MDPGEPEEDEESGEGGLRRKRKLRRERKGEGQRESERRTHPRVYTIHASGGPGEIIFYDYGRSGAAKAGDGRRLEGVMRDFQERKRMHEGASYILYIQWPLGS